MVQQEPRFLDLTPRVIGFQMNDFKHSSGIYQIANIKIGLQAVYRIKVRWTWGWLTKDLVRDE